MLAHVSCNYSLFILQAILEGTAASFSSGTQSGYIYIMFSKEHYAEKSAHVANYGTVGFFASTLAYAVLYTLIGIKGLLLATIAANLVAVFTSLKIPKETVQPRSETRQKKNIPYPAVVSAEKDMDASNDFGSFEHWPHSDQFLLCGEAAVVRDQ